MKFMIMSLGITSSGTKRVSNIFNCLVTSLRNFSSSIANLALKILSFATVPSILESFAHKIIKLLLEETNVLLFYSVRSYDLIPPVLFLLYKNV